VSTLSVWVGWGFLVNTPVSLTAVLNSGKEQCCHDKDLKYNKPTKGFSNAGSISVVEYATTVTVES